MVHEGNSEVAALLVIRRRVSGLTVCAVYVLLCIDVTLFSRKRALTRGRGSVKEKDVVRAYRSLRASGVL